jgi:hypothetical protein
MSVLRLPFPRSNPLLRLPFQQVPRTHHLRFHSTGRQRPSRFSSFIPQLSNLSTRTGVPLPSLVLSFGILHELTAILPLVLAFFIFQAAGIGGTIVEWAAGNSSTEAEGGSGSLDWRVKVGEWLEEGERRVDRISRRYGLFGRVKGEAKTLQQLELENESPREMGMDVAAAAKGSKAAQDVANALSAYLLIKVSSGHTFSLLLHRVDRGRLSRSFFLSALEHPSRFPLHSVEFS